MNLEILVEVDERDVGGDLSEKVSFVLAGHP